MVGVVWLRHNRAMPLDVVRVGQAIERIVALGRHEGHRHGGVRYCGFEVSLGWTFHHFSPSSVRSITFPGHHVEADARREPWCFEARPEAALVWIPKLLIGKGRPSCL